MDLDGVTLRAATCSSYDQQDLSNSYYKGLKITANKGVVKETPECHGERNGEEIRQRKTGQAVKLKGITEVDSKECSQGRYVNFILNLDLAPSERWKSVVSHYSKEEIQALRANFERVIKNVAPCGCTKLLSRATSAAFYANHDEKYWEELKGLSEALIDHLPEGESKTGFSVHDLYAINLGMEAFAYCTSGVLIDDEGNPFLFRNLDWDEDFFRDFTLKVKATKKGEILFNGVSFLGQVGVFTGVNSEVAVCINYRRTPDSSPGVFAEKIGLLKNAWGQITSRNRWGASLLLRNVLESKKDFQSTVARLKDEPLISPVYFIAANKEIGEYGGGLVVSRDRTSQVTQPMHPIEGETSIKAVVQTNIDWDETQGYNEKQCKEGWGGYDELLNENFGMGPVTRRDTMIQKIRTGNVTEQKNALNYISSLKCSSPVANRMTIFSAVMTPAKEELLLKVLGSQH